MATPSGDLVRQMLKQREWLLALARQLAGAGGADDLAQETWLAALERPPQRAGELRPWLAGTARNLARGLRRAVARRERRERRAARPEALPSTVELVERVDAEQRLVRELLALREPLRTTLLLRFHEGLSAEEIAARHGITSSAVHGRTKQGLEELRARLERAFGGSEALGVALAGWIRGSSAMPAASGAASTAVVMKGIAMIGGKWLAVSGALAIGVTVVCLRSAPIRTERLEGPALVEEGSTDRPSEPFDGATDPSSSSRAGAVLASPSGIPEPSRRAAVGGTRLRVLECDGRPNAGMWAVLVRKPDEERAVAKTIDEQGWVEFEARGETRTIAIQRDGVFPYRTEITLVPGEITLELPRPRGAALAGRVTVDGEPPLRPMILVLHAASARELEVDTSDPACLEAGLACSTTDPEGDFRFRGLAYGQGLNLRMPEGYALPGTKRYSDPGSGPVAHFDGPAEGVRIELERHATVHGRVLEADGAPAAHAGVLLEMTGGVWGRNTASDGTFEIFVREPPRSLSIRYGKREDPLATYGGTTAEFHFEEPGDDVDLGDLVIAATPSPGLFLVVQDPEGRPIVGAETGVSPPTDAGGRTWLEDAVPDTRIAITSRGYRTAFLTLSEPIPSSLPVVLQPTNDLTIEVRGIDGEPCARIELELAASEWFFPAERAWREDPFSSGGIGSWWMRSERHSGYEGHRGSIWHGSGARVRFHTDEAGRCSMGEMRHDLALHLSVLDSAEAVVHEEDLAPFGEREHRVVRIRLGTALRPLRGRVVNSLGEPIAGAEVGLGCAGVEEKGSRTTDNDGRFRFAHVADHALGLSVTKRGYLPSIVEPVRSSEDELELLLRRGIDVTVRVLDAAGRAVPGGKVRSTRMEETSWCPGDAVADGTFELVGLPDAPHVVELEMAFGLFRASWMPPAKEVVFSLPDAIGTVELRWNVAPDPGVVGYHVRLEPADGRPPAERHCTSGGNGTMRLDQVAGEYELVLVAQVPAAAGDEAIPWFPGRRGVDIERRALAVVAGETTRVELGR